MGWGNRSDRSEPCSIRPPVCQQVRGVGEGEGAGVSVSRGGKGVAVKVGDPAGVGIGAGMVAEGEAGSTTRRGALAASRGLQPADKQKTINM